MDERVALITGGAQGIGKGIAKVMLDKKIRVVIVDCDKKAGRETEKEFSLYGDITFYPADISDEADVKNVMTSIQKKYRRLNILVNNAGIMIRKSLVNLSLKEWHKVLGVNLTSAFLCAKYAAPLLKKTKGSIVNISSTRAYMSEPNTESYSASKGGMMALTHALAISLGPAVRVNCISPGWIEVSEWQKNTAKHAPHLRKVDKDQHPVGRVGNPEDIAELVLYLSSPEAGFITGSDFIVDGGMTRKMIYEE